MFSVETSVGIEAPPARVYEVVTDLENAAERISGIKSMEVLTDGPFGVGTRFRETRVVFGKEATEEMEVVAVTPGEGYELRAESHGHVYKSFVRVRPEGSGSVLSMGFEGHPQGMAARIVGTLMGAMMRSQTKKMMDQDLADIKRAAEGG